MLLQGRAFCCVSLYMSVLFIVFQTLLDLGASPNYKDSRGLTPLFHAVISKANERCVQMLLHDHALIGCHDDQGGTEIHHVSKLMKF